MGKKYIYETLNIYIYELDLLLIYSNMLSRVFYKLAVTVVAF